MSYDPNLLSMIGLFLAGFIALKFLPRLLAGVPFVPPEALKLQLDGGADVVVVDVRGEKEFNHTLGHIPGALNLPIQDMVGRLEQIKAQLGAYQNVPVYITCRTTNRSPHAARYLRKAGLTNIKVLDGGMVKWNRKGFPVER